MTEQHKQLTYVLYEAINQVCNHYDITLDEFMKQNLSDDKFIIWQAINNEIANKTDKEYQITLDQQDMDDITNSIDKNLKFVHPNKFNSTKEKIRLENLLDHLTEIQQ